MNDPTRTINDDGEEGVSARRETISSHLLIGVVRRQTLLDDGESQYPVPMMMPSN